MNEIVTLLRAKHPPALAIVAGILGGAASAKGGHGMLAVGGAMSIYPAYALTIVARVAIARLRANVGKC